MQTPYQTRCELAGGVLSEFVSHELFQDQSLDDHEFNIDDYFSDLKPHLTKSLKMKWEDGLTILTNSECGGGSSDTESH